MVDLFSKIVSDERSQSNSHVKKRSITQDQLDGVPCQVAKQVIMVASGVGLLARIAWIVAYILIYKYRHGNTMLNVIVTLVPSSWGHIYRNV
jgi:hypothetical protein